MSRIAYAALAAIVMIGAGGAASVAAAGGTEFVHYGRMEDYQDATFRGLLLADDGSWRLGRRWEERLADADLPFLTELVDDGETLLIAGGGTPGKLFLHDKRSGKTREIHSEPDLLFTSVAVLGKGRWAAGSGPGGRVHEIRADGRVEVLVETGEDFVWDLLFADGILWIATGESGRLLAHRLRDGRTVTAATLPDAKIFSLAAADGAILAGTSGEGLLYRLPARFGGEAEPELILDFEAEEVQQILPAADGSLHVAVARTAADCTEQCAAVYRLDPGGALEKVLGLDSAFVGDLLPHRGGGIWVASGDPAELDRLTGAYRGEVLAFEENVYYSDLHEDGETLWLLQSKPARLYRLEGRAETGSLDSEIIDLGSRARFGALRVEGEFPRGTGVEVHARSGQGPEPGPGWTPWVRADESGGLHRPDLPAAEYVQWRLTLNGGKDRSPRVDRVTLSYLPLNRAPLIGNLSVLRPVDGPFEDTIDIGGRPVTQVLERGVRVQYQLRNGAPESSEESETRLRGLRQLQWDWLDPDGDRLVATIEMRREGETLWQLIEERWEDSIYSWDTRGLPDGRYRLRVAVTDEPDNGAARALGMSAVSEPALLDSSAPEFELKLERERDGGLRVAGRVADAGGGIVARLERRRWDGDWVLVPSADGLMDRPALELDLRLDPPAEGGVLELRAADEYGNWNYFRRELGGAAR